MSARFVRLAVAGPTAQLPSLNQVRSAMYGLVVWYAVTVSLCGSGLFVPILCWVRADPGVVSFLQFDSVEGLRSLDVVLLQALNRSALYIVSFFFPVCL